MYTQPRERYSNHIDVLIFNAEACVINRSYIHFPVINQVHFLNEEAIITAVGDAVQDRLADANSSRTFLTQVNVLNACYYYLFYFI